MEWRVPGKEERLETEGSAKEQSGSRRNRHLKSDCGDFPGGPVVKTARFQCRGRGFDPWSGN